MKYIHNGNAVEKLLLSYQDDIEPFSRDKTLKFPERTEAFDEVIVLKKLVFPNYWNNGFVTKNKPELEKQINLFGQLLLNGAISYGQQSEEIVVKAITAVIEELPHIRQKLKKDIEAAYRSDPAAKSYAEIIRAYPGIAAIEIHRLNNELYKVGVRAYARELSEYAHSKTGIIIHPGAHVGECFFIDHGTGVVIGETAHIGNNVRIYQGVMLGVLSIKHVEALRGKKRHPTIEDNVTIYANAFILGGDTVIGQGSVIGGGVRITESVPPNSVVFLDPYPHQKIKITT